MHRKRVTSELHDSYFRLMTIKHAIPKTEWAIEWALNYYITLSRQLEISWSKRRDVVGKATPGRRGPRGHLMSWGPEKLLIRCGRESQHLAESWAPGPPVEHQENEKYTTPMAIRVGSIYCSSVRSPTPSHCKTLSNPFRTLTIKWEVHIFLKKFTRLLFIVSVYILHEHVYVYISIFIIRPCNIGTWKDRSGLISLKNCAIVNSASH